MLKTLPVQYPKVTCYPSHAVTMAIIGQRDDYLPWLYSNYIQLFGNRDLTDQCSNIDFYIASYAPFSCPWLESELFSRDVLANNPDGIMEWVVETINRNKYLLLYIDEFYIPAYVHCYGKFHFPHPLFIYGYDLQEEMLYAGDFFANGKFEFSKVSFRDFVNGFVHLNIDELYAKKQFVEEFYEKEQLFSVKQDVRYTFDPVNVKLMLTDYIDSTMTAAYELRYGSEPAEHWVHRYPRKHSFGMSVYESLQSDLALTAEGEGRFDVRAFAILHEHKKVLHEVIRHLESHGIPTAIGLSYREAVAKSLDIPGC